MKLDSAFLERVASSAIDAELVDAFYGFADTALGRLLVVQSPSGVCRIGFQEELDDRVLAGVAAVVGPRIVRSQHATEEVRDALVGYLEGKRRALELSVDLRLVSSAFARRVLDAVSRVERGHVTTYGQLARRVGHPRAARAAGTALARNPVPIIVPCHRVLPSSGTVGRYGGGPERKEQLLRLEGALA
jgi:methylated-DNA-[protein]-cysteine S-methyltransferase